MEAIKHGLVRCGHLQTSQTTTNHHLTYPITTNITINKKTIIQKSQLSLHRTSPHHSRSAVITTFKHHRKRIRHRVILNRHQILRLQTKWQTQRHWKILLLRRQLLWRRLERQQNARLRSTHLPQRSLRLSRPMEKRLIPRKRNFVQ